MSLSLTMKEKIEKMDKFIFCKKKQKGKLTDDTIVFYMKENEIVPYECKKCHNDGTWLGKPIMLFLDRLNNNTSDYRLENLRLLCPNCFIQLKNKKKYFHDFTKNKKKECRNCKKLFTGKPNLCRSCIKELTVVAPPSPTEHDEIKTI